MFHHIPLKADDSTAWSVSREAHAHEIKRRRRERAREERAKLREASILKRAAGLTNHVRRDRQEPVYNFVARPDDLVEFDVVKGTRVMRKIKHLQHGTGWAPMIVSLPYISMLDDRFAR